MYSKYFAKCYDNEISKIINLSSCYLLDSDEGLKFSQMNEWIENQWIISEVQQKSIRLKAQYEKLLKGNKKVICVNLKTHIFFS